MDEASDNKPASVAGQAVEANKLEAWIQENGLGGSAVRVLGWILVLLAFIFAITLAVASAMSGMGAPLEAASKLGDSFGLPAALFNAIAVGLAALAVWMQSRELEMQRRVMQAQLAEMEESTKQQRAMVAAMQAQAAAMKAQEVLLDQQRHAMQSAAERERIEATMLKIFDEHKALLAMRVAEIVVREDPDGTPGHRNMTMYRIRSDSFRRVHNDLLKSAEDQLKAQLGWSRDCQDRYRAMWSVEVDRLRVEHNFNH